MNKLLDITNHGWCWQGAEACWWCWTDNAQTFGDFGTATKEMMQLRNLLKLIRKLTIQVSQTTEHDV